MKLNDIDLALFIGSKIKYFRTKTNLKQSDLGELLHVQNNSISAYECGVVIPSMNNLKLLADYFNIKVDDFFPEDDVTVSYLKDIDNLKGEDIQIIHTIMDAVLELDENVRMDFLDKLEFMVKMYKK